MPTSPAKVTVMTVDESLPAAGQAASLALTLLRRVKVSSMADLETGLAQGEARVVAALGAIWLDPEQHDLLTEHRQVACAVSPVTPRRTIALCEVCGAYLIVAGTVPSRCAITLGCEGTYVKVQPAKSELVPAADLTPNPGTGDDEQDDDALPSDEAEHLDAPEPDDDDDPVPSDGPVGDGVASDGPDADGSDAGGLTPPWRGPWDDAGDEDDEEPFDFG
ncbi:hypothetical protein GCG21_13645 [Pseudactinotalea sp. HY160]|uniref:hypothetical protein n=1 Tax=Pseudactinotalea sp. HY160 TaxID=2654490 RepID=UPI00128DFF52|nr:hypothetical protein [Pseudactinotalea sp. HY160]MPV51030.1 hypothetical protein [Pseudactinotalea sp. HY160]